MRYVCTRKDHAIAGGSSPMVLVSIVITVLIALALFVAIGFTEYY